jgi:putative DNA methylase
VRSFWLSKKARRGRALKPSVVKSAHSEPHIEFKIVESKSERDVHKGSVTRAKATCLCCGRTLAPERVRAQLAAQHGGAEVTFDKTGRRIGGARLLAVVSLREGETGRHYRLPTERDYEAVRRAMHRLAELSAKPLPGGLSVVPNEPLPPIGILGFRVQRYGML